MCTKNALCAAVVASFAVFGGLWAQNSATPAAKSEPGLTLKTDRSVEFSTDEGTWMSVDVSPDARMLVFDLLGHLYTLPIEGGTATEITRGLEFDGQPRYSPDGRHIVFLSDRSGDDNIWLANTDGSDARPLTAEDRSLFASPCWSPEGDAILVSRKNPHFYNSGFEIWRYDLLGGSGLPIVKSRVGDAKQPTINALSVNVTPDLRYIVFAKKVGAQFADGGRILPWQIVRRNLATGEEDSLTAFPRGAFRPLLSPDGTKLIYGMRYDAKTGLRIRDLSTGSDKWLKFPIDRDDQESAFTRDILPGYAFLPGGREIVISWGGKIHRLELESGHDRVIPFQAKVSRELGPKLDFQSRVEEGPVQARVIHGAVASPDGKRFAFSSLTHLYVAEVGVEIARRVISGEGRQFEPAWSPDGRWLAYTSWSDGDGAIWKIRADGSGTPQRLTTAPASFRYLAWSPDSQRIVAVRTLPYQAISQADQWGRGMEASELVWIPAAGGTPTLIVGADGLRYPHFTDDADHIYVTMTALGALAAASELVSMRWDGSDRRTLAKLEAKDVWGRDFSPVVELLASPNRKNLLILFRSQVYLADLPPRGTEPPVINLNTPPVAVERLTSGGADEVRWADHGAAISWSAGPAFFLLPVADIESAAAAGTSAAEKRNTAEWARRLKPRETRVRIDVPRHKTQGVLLLRGARVITMRGDEVLASADILVHDNRIEAVAPAGSLQAPAGARTLDLSGRTIIPGFIDVHAHWTEIRRGVHDLDYWGFLANLAYGVTTGRDPQTLTADMFTYQDLVDAGEMIGPRAYSTGPGIFWVSDFQSADEAADVVARYKDYYRTNTVKSYMVGSRRQREFMVEACNRLRMMPTTEGAADMALDLTHVIDGFSGNEHQFPIHSIYKDVTTLVAQSGIHYTPTYIIGGYGGPAAENYYFETSGLHEDPKARRFIPHGILDTKANRILWYRPDEYVYSEAARSAAAILRAGGKVCVGGHGELQGLSFQWEMWALQSGGMSNLEALRAATINGAEAIGFEQDLGSIEKGKLADLVILRKNPLDDIHNTMAIEYVMKDGELFAGDTLDQVWPAHKPLATQWWWKDDPDSARR